MARLPTKSDLSGPESLRSGRMISSADTSAIGRGIASAGADILALGQDMKRKNLALEGTRADGNALKELNDFERGFDQDGDYGTFGKRSDEGIAKIRDKWAATITDPQARALWSGEFDKSALGARNRILNLGDARVREQQLVFAKTGLEGYQKLIADPAVSAEDRAKAKASADASIGVLQETGLLTPAEADKWRDDTITGGEFVYAQREVERDPTAIAKPLPPTLKGRADTAMQFFQSQGWTKAQAAGIVGNLIGESNLDTGARNGGDGQDGTDSIGIGQWNSDRARALKAYAGERQLDWRDFGVQLAFVQEELSGAESSAAKRLRAATNIDEATAAFVGYERPAGWSENNPRGAHNYKGRLKYAAQAAGENVNPDWFNNLPPAQQLQIERQADTRQRELMVESRAGLEIAIANAPSAILNTGSYDGTLPGPNEFMAAYGPQEGAKRYGAFQASVDTAQQAYEFQTMPAAEIAQVLKDAFPSSSGDDAALETAKYETLTSAAETALKTREADPAMYVSRAFPAVGKAWGAITAGSPPEAYQAAVGASITAQKHLGIENIRPLPKELAARSVEAFKKEDAPEAERIRAVAEVIMSTNDKEQQEALFDQLVEAGLPEITEGAVSAMLRGDEGASRRLFQAAMIDPSKLPGEIEAKPAEIDEEIQSNIMAEGAVGDIYYGITDGSAENYERAARDSKLMSNAVNLRMRQGEGLADAVQGAAKDLYGDVLVVNAPNAQILVPKGTDPDAVMLGLQETLPQVRAALASSLAMPGEAPLGAKAIVDAANANYIEQVMARGYFRNSGDGYAFIDPQTGEAIVDENNQTVIFHPAIIDPAQRAVETGKKAVDEFDQRTPEPGAGPSVDEDGNPVVLQ